MTIDLELLTKAAVSIDVSLRLLKLLVIVKGGRVLDHDRHLLAQLGLFDHQPLIFKTDRLGRIDSIPT